MVKNLRYLRNRQGISQQQLAQACGISQQSVNKYENHNVEPDISTLIAMADFFDTTIDFLVGKENENGNQGLLNSENNLLKKYRTLSDNERLCVDTVVDTFYKIKKDRES